MWFTHEDLDTFVEEEWKKIVEKGRGDYCLVEKLKTLKSRLIWWNKNVYGWIDLKINNEGREMHSLDNVFVHFAGNVPEDVVVKRIKVAEDFWDNINKREGLLRLKSRQLWLSEGDDNTRYFHNSLKDRRRRNSICSIATSEGRLEGVEDIKKFTFKHFESFFKEENPCRPELSGINLNSLSSLDSSALEKPFEEDEVKEAIWSCDGNKSPGPDGFSLEFYKKYWYLIKGDVMKCCNDFYHRGTLVKSIISSFLALIPKKKNPQDLFEYRPICLVGSLYKILTKILAARMRSVVDKLVSTNQTAFVLGRSMMDGVLMVNEILDWAKKKKRGCLLLKVDFEKAYDSVSWNYLRWILVRMGFRKRWMKWMESSIFTNYMSVLINGSATKEFKIQRGLRQGDPISPFLSFLQWKVGEGAYKKKVWQEVIDNIKSRLSKWKGRNISIGGRVTLIGSVLNVIPIFTLSFYKAPSKILQAIRSLLSNFLWCGNEKSKCIQWVKWENICKPKGKGGLGIRDVGEMNKYLLLKWKWRILKEDKAIWSNFLRLRYHNPKIKVLAASKDLINRDDSRWWRDIVLNDYNEEALGDGFTDRITCDLKQDNNVLFWHSVWLVDQPLRVFFPLLFDHITNNLCTVKDILISNNGNILCNWEAIFGDEIFIHLVPNANLINLSITSKAIGDELRDLIVLLRGVELDITAKDDFHWNLTSNGVFTVSSVSFLMSSAKEIAWPNSTIKLLDVIWKTTIPAKIKIFSWRFFIKRLPLKDQLVNRGVSILTSIDCPFCSNYPESLDHLFYQCQVTKEVWNRTYLWVGDDANLTQEEFKHFGSIQEKVTNNNIKAIINTIWLAFIWCIWNMRNTIIF
ncbi:uncharacterized protein LOC131624783 [Vicia villosa]|uniref:uncharacterized protein LOC131624783 n=1 Tax=Vicia villosa TaxID=3911 RepID=UPI00273C8B61|nr:uncharacterized protein LOC131624783 [Vicia villosa]